MKDGMRILSWLVFFAVLLAGVAGCSSATPRTTTAIQATTAASASSGSSAMTMPTIDLTTATNPTITETTTTAATASTTTAATAATTAAATAAATAAMTTVPTATATAAPIATTAAAPPASCTISVVCHTAVAYGLTNVPADGVILAPVTIPLQAGDTVLTVLIRAVAAANPTYGKSNVDVKSGAYVSGIGNDAMPEPLYEKDCGPESGWLFYIDGTYVSLGASARLVKPGEIVEWNYTCASGRDLG